MHLLADYPPSERFSEVLFQIGWNFVQHYPGASQTEPLLALFERLPKSDNNHWEGFFLRGERLLARGSSAEAAALYRATQADPALPPALVSLFASQEFAAELAGKSFAAAARIFERLEPGADVGNTMVVDAFVRAILLALEEGRTDAAWRFTRRLAETPDEVLAATAAVGQAQGFKRMAADEAGARQAWQSQQQWWPAWLALGRKLGRPAGGQPVAELVDFATVQEQVDGLLRQNQPGAAYAALEGLAHAARWDPAMAIGFAVLVTAELGGREAAELQITVLKALPPAPDPTQQAKQLLVLGSALYDAQRAAEAQAQLRALLELDISGPLHQRGAAILGLAAVATGEGMAEARDRLAGVLDDSYPPDGRGMAVLALADLHTGLGQPEEARKLLQREVANPLFAGTEALAELESRLAASRLGGQGDLFDLAWEGFRKRFPLPFLALAEPASLDDPRLAGKDADEIFDGDWLPAEKVKLAYLMAADRRRPVAEKGTALSRMAFELRHVVPSQQRCREMLQAIFADDRFPAALRSDASFAFAIGWSEQRNLGELAAFLARPDIDLRPRAREILEVQRALIAASEESPEALERYVAGLAAKRQSDAEAAMFSMAYIQLVLRGPQGAAERLAPQLEKLQTAAPERADELRLEAARALVDFTEGRRLVELLRRKIPAPAGGRPALVAAGMYSGLLESLAPEQCRELLRYEVYRLDLDLAHTANWPIYYLLCGERGDGSAQLVIALLREVLELDLRDETKAQWLAAVAVSLGEDEPLWPELLAAARARGTAAENKETGRLLRVFEISRQLRAGGTVDFKAEKKETQGFDRSLLLAYEAQVVLRDRDPAAAQAFLASHTATELKDPTSLPAKVALARLAPGSAEAKWIEKAARRQVYEDRLEALTSCSWTHASRAIELTRLLDGAATYDREWFDWVLGCQETPVGRAALRLGDAEARQDWPAAYASAQELIAREPLDHDDQFRLGRAAFHLGKKEEAKAALSLFLEAARNHSDQPAARELLARLAAGS